MQCPLKKISPINCLEFVGFYLEVLMPSISFQGLSTGNRPRHTNDAN